MANANICDRCGNLITGWTEKIHLGLRWHILSMKRHGSLCTYDLCPDCRKKLERFMDGAEVEASE